MVDFGLSRFLEMFEERFGRTPTTLLLGVVGCGIAAVCAAQIWNYLVSPLYTLFVNVVRLPGWKISLSIFPAIISSSITLLLIAGAMYLYARWRMWILPRLSSRAKKISEKIEEQGNIARRNIERVRRLQAEIDTQIEHLTELQGQFEERAHRNPDEFTNVIEPDEPIQRP